jgi:hypothetical protein
MMNDLPVSRSCSFISSAKAKNLNITNSYSNEYKTPSSPASMSPIPYIFPSVQQNPLTSVVPSSTSQNKINSIGFLKKTIIIPFLIFFRFI